MWLLLNNFIKTYDDDGRPYSKFGRNLVFDNWITTSFVAYQKLFYSQKFLQSVLMEKE